MSTDSMTGRTFSGRYEITERIGIGGMAEVYSAQDNVLGRVVAVKVMLPQYAADPEFTQRFRQEAAAAANLQSPYIVNVYDWGQDENTYYIVMEFVRGSDLKTAIVQRGAINQRKVAEIGAQVCQALTVAHNQDIIHRDIKPQNIMVQPDGNVKVMDFGIARAKNSVKQQTSAVLGTAHYISPEQAQGKELTAASDIYSLGVVMYEATTGRLPFDGPDAVNVALQQVQDAPVPPSQINPAIDPVLEDIILCAMEKDPARRFATANDMRLALNDYLAGRAGGSMATAVMGTAGATAVMGGSGATAVMNGGVAPMGDGTLTMPTIDRGGGMKPATGSGSGNRNMRSNRTSYREPEKKPKKGIFVALGILVALVLVAGGMFLLSGGDIGAKERTVPDVTNKTYDEAKTLIEADGFVVGEVERVPDDKVKEDRVIEQDPRGGTRQPEGTRINLRISLGADEFDAPKIIDLTPEQAENIAKQYDLKLVANGEQASEDIEEGRIVSQTPEPGQKVKAGDTITYIVSTGPAEENIPGVVGMDEQQAINTIEEAGFNVAGIERVYSSTTAAGYVISQDPRGGNPAQAGAGVTLVVSRGPEPAPQPPSGGNSGGNGGEGNGGGEGGEGGGGEGNGGEGGGEGNGGEGGEGGGGTAE